ncbi:MAG: (S)-acetoin forming diacetyl reductase [Promethearchaeota archaeon]
MFFSSGRESDTMSQIEGRRLLDKVCVVSGAGSGIGKATALLFARHGAHVVCADVNEDTAKQTAAEVEALGRRALAVRVDVSKSDEVDRLVEKTHEKFPQVDVLFNNAGIGNSSVKGFLSVTEEEWDRIFAVNVKGVFLMTKAFVKKMRRNKTATKDGIRGKIINNASARGKLGKPQLAPYSASKAAVIRFTQAIAADLGNRRITINAVCPGTIYTNIWGNATPEQVAGFGGEVALFRKVGFPEDVARVVLFLASSDSDFMTGQAINVCGGQVFH